jgi:hypothetical protein
MCYIVRRGALDFSSVVAWKSAAWLQNRKGGLRRGNCGRVAVDGSHWLMRLHGALTGWESVRGSARIGVR